MSEKRTSRVVGASLELDAETRFGNARFEILALWSAPPYPFVGHSIAVDINCRLPARWLL